MKEQRVPLFLLQQSDGEYILITTSSMGTFSDQSKLRLYVGPADNLKMVEIRTVDIFCDGGSLSLRTAVGILDLPILDDKDATLTDSTDNAESLVQLDPAQLRIFEADTVAQIES